MPPSTILALIAILLSAPLISLVSGFVPYYNPGLPTRSPTPTTTPNPNATPQPFNSTLCSTPTTSGVYPQCWDILSMDTYLRTWYHNPTTTSTSSSACLPDEPWSYCFTRLADLSNLLNCSMIAAEEWCAAPIDISGGRNKIELEVWYGVYAIWAVNQYLSTYYSALYALPSQPALSNLASILAQPGLPRLTVSSLLSVIIHQFPLVPEADFFLDAYYRRGGGRQCWIKRKMYMSTQVGELPRAVLAEVMDDFLGGGFKLLTMHGALMNFSAEEAGPNLEARLAGKLVEGLLGT